MISHYFNCPCETLKVSLRDSNNDCESNLWMAEDAFKESKNILIVDDINDTGQTLDWIVNDWQQSCTGIIAGDRQQSTWNHNVKFACIVDNLSSNFAYNVDYTGFEINKAETPVWIEFPYEQWWLQ
jgi:hypoxanthine phosphoribosyltransferase